MPLKNEHIGLAVGLLILVIGRSLVGADPGQPESALVVTAGFGAALGLSIYLNLRSLRR